MAPGMKCLISYGTTLLAAAIAPELAIFFQLGDGDILLLCEGEAAKLFLSNLRSSMERSHIHCVNPAATTTQEYIAARSHCHPS